MDSPKIIGTVSQDLQNCSQQPELQHDLPHVDSPITIDTALDTVDAFGQTNGIALAHNFSPVDGSLHSRSLVNSMKAFFSCVISKNEKNKLRHHRKVVQQVLDKSIKVLSIYASRIQTLTEGNEDEKRLAHRVIHTIEQFNASRKKRQKVSVSHKVLHFLYELIGVSFDTPTIYSPIPISLFYRTHQITEKPPNSAYSKISDVLQRTHKQQEDGHSFSQTERELFIMKSITRLQQDGLISKEEIAHTLSLLRHRTLLSSLIFHDDNPTVELSTSLELFPGEKIHISGSFLRNLQTKRTNFIADSAKIHIQSIQTGFPHPIQTIGFAFSHKILVPHIMTHSGLQKINTYELLVQKQQLAQKLLPHSTHNHQIKQLFKVRNDVMNKKSTYFLQLLQHLLRNMFQWDHAIHFPTASTLQSLSYLHAAIVGKVFAHPQYEELDTSNYTQLLFQKLQQSTPGLRALIATGDQGSYTVTSFEQKVIRSALRHQITFLNESRIDLDSPLLEQQIFEGLESLFLSEIADFSNELPRNRLWI